MRQSLWAAAFVLFLVVGFTAYQAWAARSALVVTRNHLSAASSAVARADADAALSEVREAGEAAASARKHTRGPIWWLASNAPLIGDDVTAVRTVADVSNDLLTGALQDLVRAASNLSGQSLRPKGGRIPLEPMSQAAPVLAQGSKELEAASDRIDGLRVDGLSAPVRGPVLDLKRKLGRAASVSGDAAAVAQLLPEMLGAGGDRTYLLLFQNNAEARSLGGLGGAFAVVRANGGSIQLTRTSRPADIGYLETPVDRLTNEERTVFGDDIVRYSQDTPQVPDFPRAAELLAQMWERTQGERIDGVLSFDPVALAYLMRATGPVAVAGRTLTSSNAVDTLLRDTYLEIPTDDQQNAFFSGVTRAVFDRIANGQFAPDELARSLKRGAQERRLLAWSRVPSEQVQLASASIGGALPQSKGSRPEVGVYVNDGGSDKLTYYLTYRTDVRADRCYLGAQRLHVRTVLRSLVPPGALTRFVLGEPSPGLPPGDIRLTTYAYGPVGGRLDSIRVDGHDIPFSSAQHLGRPVATTTLDIPRRSERVIEYEMYSARGQSGDARLLTTPGARTDGIGSVGPSAC